jgi:hypothetical protein
MVASSTVSLATNASTTAFAADGSTAAIPV